MISIIQFELLKIAKSKVFLLMILLCFIQLVGLHYFEVTELESPIKYSEIYTRELNYYQSLEMDSIDNSIEERIKEANVAIAFGSVESSLYSDVLQTQQSLYPIQVEKYLSGDLDLEFSEASILKKVLIKISEDKSYIAAFDNHVNQVIQQSLSMANISIFSQSNESSKNIEKTAEDYKKIQEVKTIWNDHLAFERFINNDCAYISCLVVLLFAVSSLTVSEKNEGVNTLINSTILGGRKTILAKLVALILLSLVVVLFFYGTSICYYHFLYQFNNMKDSVQSCVGFQNFTVPLNCLETTVLLIVVRWLFISTVMLVVFALLIKTGSSTIVAGLVTSFLMIEGIFVYLISFQSNMSLLRYINIFTLIDIHFSLFEYQNVAVFTKVLSMKRIMLTIVLLMMIISIITILTSKNELIYSKLNSMHFRRISSYFTAHSRLVIHEIYQSLVHKKGLIILILLFIYFGFKQDVYKPHFIDNSYFHLIEKFQGKFDENKEKELNLLIQTVEKTEEELSIAYNQMRNGKVSADYYYKKWQNSYQIINLSNVLTEIQFQLARVNHEQKAIVDYEGYKILFDYEVDPYRLNGTTIDYVVLIVALNLCVAPLFSNDNYKNIKELYITTLKGNSSRNVSKVITAILYATVITIIFCMWKYMAVNKYFLLDCGNEKIWNVPDLVFLSEAFTLNQAYLIQFVVRCGQLILLSILFLAISKYSKNVFSAIMKSLILSLAPILLLYLGCNYIESYMSSWYFLRLEAYILNSAFVLRQVACIILIVFFFIVVVIDLKSIKYKEQIETMLSSIWEIVNCSK